MAIGYQPPQRTAFDFAVQLHQPHPHPQPSVMNTNPEYTHGQYTVDGRQETQHYQHVQRSYEYPQQARCMMPKQSSTMDLPSHDQTMAGSPSPYLTAPSPCLPPITPPAYPFSSPRQTHEAYYQYQNQFQSSLPQPLPLPLPQPQTSYRMGNVYSGQRPSEDTQNGPNKRQKFTPTPPPSASTSPNAMFTHPNNAAMMPKQSLAGPFATASSYGNNYLAPSKPASPALRRSGASNTMAEYPYPSPPVQWSVPPSTSSRDGDDRSPTPQAAYSPQGAPRQPTARPTAFRTRSPAEHQGYPPRLDSRTATRLTSFLDPASNRALSLTCRSLFDSLRPRAGVQKCAFVLNVESKTLLKHNSFGCYACGWSQTAAAFASRAPLAVRAGLFAPGLESEGLDRFPRTEEWIWGGVAPQYGDWRIVDVKHPPEPDDQNKKRGPNNPNNVQKRDFWQRSDINIPFPPDFVPGSGARRRWWPGGKPPSETVILFLRRFCMDCGARAGVHAIKDKITLHGITKSAKGDGSTDKADRWVCGCRKVQKFCSLVCDTCGQSCTFTPPPRSEEDEGFDWPSMS
ncbi:hypothetical protein MKZ38_007364 [Zalerion maritima]|uniref:Uncharacterized protein n=1 Tax=Zalerion maritima TaxID=339359 RepID=A0AAD5RIK2_9PEZI|nr:hypothetical protein MKZ38_007364 [Zalerion maritima]